MQASRTPAGVGKGSSATRAVGKKEKRVIEEPVPVDVSTEEEVRESGSGEGCLHRGRG